jgi:hypothetical protein
VLRIVADSFIVSYLPIYVALLTRGVLCFDLRDVASPKRQTNGKISQSFIEHRDGGVLIRCSKNPLPIVLDLRQY